MGALMHWWPLAVLCVVYLVSVLCCALSQAFDGGGAWWEPLVVPVALVALAVWRARVLAAVVAVSCMVLWGVYR